VINSRLYYDLKELPAGVLKFCYYTHEMNEDAVDLKSFIKKIDRKEVLLTLNKIGIDNLLYNINEAEFLKLLMEVKEYKNHIEKLSLTDPSEANIAITKLWGPNELQRKFTAWFKNNGFTIPSK